MPNIYAMHAHLDNVNVHMLMGFTTLVEFVLMILTAHFAMNLQRLFIAVWARAHFEGVRSQSGAYDTRAS